MIFACFNRVSVDLHPHAYILPMRNTLYMIGLLGVLATIFFVFLYDRDQTSLQQEEIAFAIEDTSAIQQIVLNRMIKGQSRFRIQLDRMPNGTWQLNERYPALEPKVQQLLKVLHLIQVKEVLAGEGISTAKDILRAVHTQVEVFDQEGKTIKSFLLGTETKEATGTLLQLSDAETPYIVEMPGLQGYINASFPVDEMLWRANLLFHADLPQIQQIAVSYPDANQSFVLERSSPESEWGILGLEQKPDSNRLATYLGHFQGNIYAETFATADYPGKLAQLQTQEPDIQMAISYFSGDSRHISLFERAENPNNYFGWLEGQEELLTIQHFVFDKFLQDRSYLLGWD